MLQVSTVDIVVIWKFEEKRDKIALFTWEREVSFFQLYGIWGLINQDMLRTLTRPQSSLSCLYSLIIY